MNVVFIDDDPIIRGYLVDFVQYSDLENHSVFVVDSVDSFLKLNLDPSEKLKTYLDMGLNDESTAYENIGRIKKNYPECDLNIVTGYDYTHFKREVKEYKDSVQYTPKPFGFKEFQQIFTENDKEGDSGIGTLR